MPFFMKIPNTGRHTRLIEGVRKPVADGEVIECTAREIEGARNKFIEVPGPDGRTPATPLFSMVDVSETSGAEPGTHFAVVNTKTGRPLNEQPMNRETASKLVAAANGETVPPAPTKAKGK